MNSADRSIPGHVDTPVRELIVEEGRVIGVRAEKDGNDFFVGANKGVILAIGGYDHNKKMATMYENTKEWNSATLPYFHGDHLVMGGEIGASIAAVPPTNLSNSRRVRSETPGGSIFDRVLLP